MKAQSLAWRGADYVCCRRWRRVAGSSALLTQVSAWQQQDLPRRITFANGLRAVGFGDLPAYPCGGTHVASLAALGNIVISQLKMKKGQMIVSYNLE